MHSLDYYIASRVIKAGPSSQMFPNVDQAPYSVELNKKQPTLTKEDMLPENIGSYPKMPEQVKPLVHALVSNLQLLRQKEEEIKKQEAIFKEMIAPQVQEKNQLKVKLNEEAQVVGKAIQDIDPTIDLVLTTFNEFMVAAQEKLVQSTQQTMAPDAQIELLKGLLIQANKELAEQVLTKFDQAIQQFNITTQTVQKTVRVWPIPQEKMKSKAYKLAQEIENDVSSLVERIHTVLIQALSGLHSLVGLFHKGTSDINKDSNVVKMPTMQRDVPLAALKKLSNAK